MKKTLILICFLALVSGCVYPYDFPLPDEEQYPLVIDGTIILGQNSRIRITYLQAIEESNATYPSSADVVLEAENGSTYTFFRENSGYYFLNSSSLPGTEKYRLKIDCDNNTYYSEWLQAMETPVIKKLEIVSNGIDVLPQISVDASSGEGYVAIHFQEKWKFHADYAIHY